MVGPRALAAERLAVQRHRALPRCPRQDQGSSACRVLMPVNRESNALIPILEGVRVPRDGVIVVHSAIARLSRQGFRAEGMIEAFLNYMRNGTVVMPTMTWRTVTPKNPHWDEIETRSETGVMTEMFRTRYASSRSIHPTH